MPVTAAPDGARRPARAPSAERRSQSEQPAGNCVEFFVRIHTLHRRDMPPGAHMPAGQLRRTPPRSENAREITTSKRMSGLPCSRRARRRPRHCRVRVRSPPGAGKPPSCDCCRAASPAIAASISASGIPGKPAPLPTSSTLLAARCGTTARRIEQVVAHHLFGCRAPPSGCRRGSIFRSARDSRASAAASSGAIASPVRRCPSASCCAGLMLFSARRTEAALQMHQQQRNRRRRDAGNARGLAEGFGLVLIQLLLHFDRQAAHLAIIEIARQARRLQTLAGARFRRAGARYSR